MPLWCNIQYLSQKIQVLDAFLQCQDWSLNIAGRRPQILQVAVMANTAKLPAYCRQNVLQNLYQFIVFESSHTVSLSNFSTNEAMQAFCAALRTSIFRHSQHSADKFQMQTVTSHEEQLENENLWKEMLKLIRQRPCHICLRPWTALGQCSIEDIKSHLLRESACRLPVCNSVNICNMKSIELCEGWQHFKPHAVKGDPLIRLPYNQPMQGFQLCDLQD